MFHRICQVSVYVREISTCVLFITLKIMIFFPYVAKWIRRFQWKQCWPVVTPQTAPGEKMILEGSFFVAALCWLLADLWHWPFFAAFIFNCCKGDQTNNKKIFDCCFTNPS